MRYLLLTLALVGCGGSEAITETSSPVGCWQSDSGRLALMPGGQWQQTFAVSPTTDSGTWSYDDRSRELSLSIANASASNGPGLTTWRVVDLTPAEMSTAVGASMTQWQSVTCTAADVPVCASVETLTACAGHAADGRPCAVCSAASAAVTGCHAFRDAAQGTGVTGPAVIADYECVASCSSCQ